MSESQTLSFTGERFTPECVREIWYEHWHRYAFARRMVSGKRVLDAACGEGYGTALLAAVATEAVGVDIDAATIAHASTRYAAIGNLRYHCTDVTRLPFPDRSFDVVVSFETLEHLAAQEALLAEFARVLAADGMLVLSSPDKRTYSDLTGFRNEFHVRELYRDELLALLQPHFSAIHLFGQKLLFQSAIWSLSPMASAGEASTAIGEGGPLQEGLAYEPIYYLAVCSNAGLPADLPAMSWFGDREESVYSHYNHEIRKNMAAGAHIAGLEAEISRLRATIATLQEQDVKRSR
ncbi:MAG: class I SAM-dependent methyltransferase [Dokdonella sp.]|uniref:class I SAM-dependent methyltransferase n=1 Tax=Dokdonella sp. TaxID=2291710 RepID=UPI0025BB9C8F|nr:class I SAM-dependent methyltransferase [Dokdonella sp.]MBZ0223791.1 class I SAM-dependent methyltransferase [Dokdonella sp.]MCC7254823.1 class I SAM-dependent methyltransferase [Dokdonella sp.]